MKSRMQRKHKSQVGHWVEAADHLSHDIAERMSYNEERLGVVTDRAHPRQTNPRRVARIMSEGEIDKVEAKFENSQSEGDREKLIGAYDRVTSQPEYKTAMETKRHDSSIAAEERKDILAEQEELGNMNEQVMRNRYDLMSVKQAGMTEVSTSREAKEALAQEGSAVASMNGGDGGAIAAEATVTGSGPSNEGGAQEGLENMSGMRDRGDGVMITKGNFDPNDSSLKNEGLALMGMGDENAQPEMPSMDDLRGRSDAIGDARDEAFDEAKSDPMVSNRLSQMFSANMDEGYSAPGPAMDRASES
ncbi:MAG: hypothetical protein Alpg2KO_31380 [Alphaproteobacteria bacterium]